MTTIVILLAASTSPFAKPSDWTDAGHLAEQLSSGAKGGDGSTGTSRRGGSGGGAGVYAKLTYSSGSLGSTTAFAVKDNNTLTSYNVSSSTIWVGTTASNSFEAKAGLAGTNAGTSTTTAGSFVTNGTPAG